MTRTTILICYVFVFSGLGCRKRDTVETTEPQHSSFKMKGPNELRETFVRLGELVDKEEELQKNIENIMTTYSINTDDASQESRLRDLYGVIFAPQHNIVVAKEAMRFFKDIQATDVLRQGLLHENIDIIILAADGIAEMGSKGEPDNVAIPYLIHVLSKNNFPQPGSEIAGLHRRMKRELLQAIREITELDIDPNMNVNDPEAVDEVLAKTRAWAKKQGIEL